MRMNMILNRLIRWLKNTPKNRNEWAIGIYLGNSPFNLWPSKKARNPVLTSKDIKDIECCGVADPFITKKDNLWYMFFEVISKKPRKGDIGLAISKNAIDWSYKKIVLKEDFHLAYPYIFEWQDNYYMIISSRTEGIRLYKATEFPFGWDFVKTMIKGNFVDASIVYYNKKLWMFVENSSHKNDTLRLYYSKNLEGKWIEHPKSPIVKDNSSARPAGKMIMYNNFLVRYAQDCCDTYGNKVLAFKVTNLTTKQYEEERIEKPVLLPGNQKWNAKKMHHVCPQQITENLWLACVDGHS
jgi:hypothetical protein